MLRGNKLDNVDDYLRSKFIYMGENIETLLTPEYMLSGLEVNQHIVGDCDDISTLHAALLTCMDIPVRFVAIRATYTDPNFDHVYIEAKDGNTWRLFDCTVPKGTTIESFAIIRMDV